MEKCGHVGERRKSYLSEENKLMMHGKDGMVISAISLGNILTYHISGDYTRLFVLLTNPARL